MYDVVDFVSHFRQVPGDELPNAKPWITKDKGRWTMLIHTAIDVVLIATAFATVTPLKGETGVNHPVWKLDHLIDGFGFLSEESSETNVQDAAQIHLDVDIPLPSVLFLG